MSGGEKTKKICFVSLSAYPLLVGENMGFLGGAEMRLVRLAREVKRQGFEVSFITYGNGGEPVEYADNIRVIERSESRKSSNISKSILEE